MTNKQLLRAARKVRRWQDHWNEAYLTDRERRCVEIELFKSTRALINKIETALKAGAKNE